MNTVSHNANQEDQQKEVKDSTSTGKASKAETRQRATTPRNDNINVFEFEPNGFMSRGRW